MYRNDQIATKAKELKDSDFLGKHGVQLVGYSPYKRAKLTCEGLFGSSGLPTKVSLISGLGLEGYYAILSVSCLMWGGVLDSSGVL